MPVAPPEDMLTEEEWRALKANMGKRGRKRTRADAQLDEDVELEEAHQTHEGEFPLAPWTLEEKHKKIREYGLEMLDWFGEDRYRNWMFHSVIDLRWYNEHLETSYNQVKYVLTRKNW